MMTVAADLMAGAATTRMTMTTSGGVDHGDPSDHTRSAGPDEAVPATCA